MNKRPTDGGDRSPGTLCLAAGAFGGALVAATELVPLAFEWEEIPFDALNVASYLIALFAIPILVVGLHALAALAAHRVLDRFAPSAIPWFWLLLAAVFGAAWQDTIMQGDGIRALSYYDVIRVLGFIIGPAAVVFVVKLTAFSRKIPFIASRDIAAALLVTACICLHLVFPAYKPFHGYLGIFAAGWAVWLLAPVLGTRTGHVASWALLILSAVAALALPWAEAAQRYVQRFGHVPSAFLSLPTTLPFQIPPESLVGPGSTVTAAQIDEVNPPPPSEVSKAHGKNVLMIVLESTRADSWADPQLAPRFHEWRENGLYFPRAVSQYPATPLAYGAMFTSQPPTILTETPNWARSRLFNELAPHFDHFVLSKPRDEWFEMSAITDFFVPRDAEVMKHDSVTAGLANVKRGLGDADGGSFFAWVHIYEPHQPWTAQRRFIKEPTEKISPAERYRSEVAYVDDALGDFMRWFYEQPSADDTLVVLIGDHGEGLGERIDGRAYWGHHVHVHNVVSHVPAYVSGPGIPNGEVATGYTIQQLDVMPTLFDFLGHPLPADAYAQGRSVYELMRERPVRPLVTEAFSMRGKEFFEFVEQVQNGELDKARNRLEEVTRIPAYSPKLGLQIGKYKLVRDMLLRRTRVYDLEKDPEEAQDLASRDPEAYEEVLQEFERWRARQQWVLHQLEK